MTLDHPSHRPESPGPRCDHEFGITTLYLRYTFDMQIGQRSVGTILQGMALRGFAPA